MSTAFVHGKQVYFTINSQNISGYIHKVDFPRSADTAETSTFGNLYKTFLAGLRSGTISIEGYWDPTLDSIMEGVFALEVSYVYAPQGNTTGNVKYSGNAIVTAYNPPGDITAAVKFTATLQLSGPVSHSVI